MPKLLKRPEDRYKLNVLCNIEDCLKRQDIDKKKLKLLLGISMPTLNKCYKDPAYFSLGQLMIIARIGKVAVEDLVSKKRGGVKNEKVYYKNCRIDSNNHFHHSNGE